MERPHRPPAHHHRRRLSRPRKPIPIHRRQGQHRRKPMPANLRHRRPEDGHRPRSQFVPHRSAEVLIQREQAMRFRPRATHHALDPIDRMEENPAIDLQPAAAQFPISTQQEMEPPDRPLDRHPAQLTTRGQLDIRQKLRRRKPPGPRLPTSTAPRTIHPRHCNTVTGRQRPKLTHHRPEDRTPHARTRAFDPLRRRPHNTQPHTLEAPGRAMRERHGRPVEQRFSHRLSMANKRRNHNSGFHLHAHTVQRSREILTLAALGHGKTARTRRDGSGEPSGPGERTTRKP